jgi:hypothetical protein
MFGENDLAGFFDDFGEPAILPDGTEVTVIFDAAFSEASPMGVGIESSRPMITARSCDVEDLAHGDTISIRDTNYSVVGIQPDGTGMTQIILSE